MNYNKECLFTPLKTQSTTEGVVFSPVINLHEFCRMYGLDRANLLRVHAGKSKSHKGWTKFNSHTKVYV